MLESGITKISSELRQEVLTFYPNQFEIRKKTKTGKESISPLEKYKELFKGDEVKAKQVVECLRKLREKRQAKKSYEWNIEDVLQEFHIDRKQLDSYLKKTVKEEGKSTSLEYHGQDLHSYCLEQGYNYEILVKALRLHSFCGHDTLEQLINRILTQTPNRIPTWIYENYGTLIEQKLIWLKLDKSKILKSMSQNIIPLEEAIRHDIFLQERKEQTNDWLEEPYNYLVEQINSGQGRKETEENLAYNFYMLVKKYHLTPSEYQILWNSISHYINTIHSYQIIDVGLAGRTIDKIEKIKKYQLDQDDIKESYLFALSFDKKLSQRSDLLRSFLMKKGSDIQEVQKSLKNTLTEKEFSAIQKDKSRNESNHSKSKKIKIVVGGRRDERNQKYTDTELEEALVICNRKYPKKDHIPQKAVVILKDGRVVKIGNWGSNIKTGNTHSSKEIKAILDKLFPNQLTYQRHFYTDQEIKEAIKKYKEENPTLQWIDSSAVVILDNGKRSTIGSLWTAY